jgi:hypothetical protein
MWGCWQAGITDEAFRQLKGAACIGIDKKRMSGVFARAVLREAQQEEQADWDVVESLGEEEAEEPEGSEESEE